MVHPGVLQCSYSFGCTSVSPEITGKVRGQGEGKMICSRDAPPTYETCPWEGEDDGLQKRGYE
jgi:hypothetical protein